MIWNNNKGYRQTKKPRNPRGFLFIPPIPFLKPSFRKGNVSLRKGVLLVLWNKDMPNFYVILER